MRRLTEAGRRELQFLLRTNCVCRFNDKYGPIKRLLADGLVSRSAGKCGGGMYRITDLGRSALAQSEEK